MVAQTFDTNSVLELKDMLTKANALGIVVESNPTLDSMGAALGLYLVLEKMGKKVSIVCKTDPLVEISSLVGIDKVGKELSGGKDLTISLPYKQGAIEKISYNIEGERINLVIKSGSDGIAFESSDVQFLRTGGAFEVLFTFGVKNQAQISEFMNLTDSNVFLVNIDNASTNERFGTLAFIDPAASSISELTANLIQMLEMTLDIDSAQNLLSGIDFATKNFQDDRTSALAFEMAAQLLKNGARRNIMKRSDVSQPQSQLPKGFPSYEFPEEPEFPPFPEPELPKQEPVQGREQGQQRQPQYQQPRQGGPRFTGQPDPRRRDDRGRRNDRTQGGGNPPSDWLTPKIFKGSTRV